MAKTQTQPTQQTLPETSPETAAAAEVQETQQTQATQTTTQATETQPATQETQSPSFLDVLKEKGFADVADEKSAQQRLLEAWETERKQLETLTQKYQQLEPLAEYGQRYLVQQQAPQQKPEEKPAEATSWWSPPKVDMSLVRRFQESKYDPATQQTVTEWKPGTPADIRAAYEAHQAHQEQWAVKLVENPVEALAPFEQNILQKVEKLLDEKYGEKIGAQTEQQFYQQIEEENKDWLFELDPVTRQPMVDRMSGAPVLSKQGQEVVEHWHTLSGVADLNARWMYATAMLQRDKEAAQRQVAETRVQAAQTAEQKRSDLIKRNTSGAANRNGSQTPAELASTGSQNRKLSASEKLRQQMRKDGITLPS